MQKSILRYFTVFIIGAFSYGLIEIAVRGFSHISMGLLGGLTMLVITTLNNARRHGFPFAVQIIITTAFITSAELVTGIIININMKLNVWDYSDMPMNYKGQICLPFVFFWILLSLLGTVVDEVLRYSFFHTDRILLPHFGSKKHIS